jgi:hypothetical protein
LILPKHFGGSFLNFGHILQSDCYRMGRYRGSFRNPRWDRVPLQGTEMHSILKKVDFFAGRPIKASRKEIEKATNNSDQKFPVMDN